METKPKTRLMHISIAVTIISSLVFLACIYTGVTDVQTSMDKLVAKQAKIEKNQIKSMFADSVIKSETKRNRLIDSLKFENLQYTVDKNVEILQDKPKTTKK